MGCKVYLSFLLIWQLEFSAAAYDVSVLAIRTRNVAAEEMRHTTLLTPHRAPRCLGQRGALHREGTMAEALLSGRCALETSVIVLGVLSRLSSGESIAAKKEDERYNVRLRLLACRLGRHDGIHT